MPLQLCITPCPILYLWSQQDQNDQTWHRHLPIKDYCWKKLSFTFSCTTCVEFITKVGGNEEICLFSSHRDIFIKNREEQQNMKVGYQMGLGDFGLSNGKFFHQKKPAESLQSKKCVNTALSWLCDSLAVTLLSPAGGRSPAIVRPHLSVPQIFKLKMVAKINNNTHFNG